MIPGLKCIIINLATDLQKTCLHLQYVNCLLHFALPKFSYKWSVYCPTPYHQLSFHFKLPIMPSMYPTAWRINNHQFVCVQSSQTKPSSSEIFLRLRRNKICRTNLIWFWSLTQHDNPPLGSSSFNQISKWSLLSKTCQRKNLVLYLVFADPTLTIL